MIEKAIYCLNWTPNSYHIREDFLKLQFSYFARNRTLEGCRFERDGLLLPAQVPRIPGSASPYPGGGVGVQQLWRGGRPPGDGARHPRPVDGRRRVKEPAQTTVFPSKSVLVQTFIFLDTCRSDFQKSPTPNKRVCQNPSNNLIQIPRIPSIIQPSNVLHAC